MIKRKDTIKDEQGHSQVWPSSPGNSFRQERRIAQILSSLKPQSTVLELGCGHGELTVALLRAGHTVVAVDRSALMIETTRLACAGSAKLTLVQNDVDEYLRNSRTLFDAVVGMGILHHCAENLEGTLRAISSRLALDGRGLFWEPNRQNPIVKFVFGTSLGRQWMSLEETENAFDQERIAGLLKEIFPRFAVNARDWAYPGVPVFLQKISLWMESKASSRVKPVVSQSLWIEFYR